MTDETRNTKLDNRNSKLRSLETAMCCRGGAIVNRQSAIDIASPIAAFAAGSRLRGNSRALPARRRKGLGERVQAALREPGCCPPQTVMAMLRKTARTWSGCQAPFPKGLTRIRRGASRSAPTNIFHSPPPGGPRSRVAGATARQGRGDSRAPQSKSPSTRKGITPGRRKALRKRTPPALRI